MPEKKSIHTKLPEKLQAACKKFGRVFAKAGLYTRPLPSRHAFKAPTLLGLVAVIHNTEVIQIGDTVAFVLAIELDIQAQIVYRVGIFKRIVVAD